MNISENEKQILLSSKPGKVWKYSVPEEIKLLSNNEFVKSALGKMGKSITDDDFKNVSEAEVADKVFNGKFPDVYCIFGRGIEKRRYRSGDSSEPILGDASFFGISDSWYSTPFFEQVMMPRRTHTGVGIHPDAIDLNALNTRFAGAGESVFASYVLLKGLADMGRFPKQVVFAAGRTECLLEEIFAKYDVSSIPEVINDKNKKISQMLDIESRIGVDPTTIISEGMVLSNELLGMLSQNYFNGLKSEDLKYEVRGYNENGLSKTHVATIALGSSNVEFIRIPNNFDTKDDAKVTFDLTNGEGIARFMTVGVHAPRSQLLIEDLMRNSSKYIRENLDAKMISADNVLKMYAPAYKTFFMALEEVPAYMRTNVDEIAGAQRLI